MKNIIFYSFALITSSTLAEPIINNVNVGSYDYCRLINNGDDFIADIGAHYDRWSDSKNDLSSRSFVLYFYKNDSSIDNSKTLPYKNASLNNEPSSVSTRVLNYTFYLGAGKSWKTVNGYSAEIKLNIPKNFFSEWDGMAISIANRDKNGNLYLNRDKAAYFTSKSNGKCQYISPENPPTPPIDANFVFELPAAWDLGKILPGKSSVTFSSSKNQKFCIKYNNNEIAKAKFILIASSDNTQGSFFNLKNIEDIGNYIPYKLELNDGLKTLKFPSSSIGETYTFDENKDEVCFAPTFNIFANENPKIGKYSDTLNFNLIVKP